MRTLRKMRPVPLLLPLLLTIMLVVPAAAMAAQPPVELGTTSSFAVLAGSTITNTGPTTINGDAGGDVGLYPGASFTGQSSVTLTGTVHLSDDAARFAKDDLAAAYNDAAGRTPVRRIPTELGGSTLLPGVYDSASGTFQITGTLTLDAQGDPNAVFIFKSASTLITASNSNVSLLNGARFCRVFWQVGSSATLGVNSHFVGHIFALTSITANTGATVQGQLLARNGAVTLDTNTITNGLCPTIATTTTTSSSSTTSTVPGSSATTTTTTTSSTTTTTSTPTTTTTTAPSTTTTSSSSTTSTVPGSSTTTSTPTPTTTTTLHRHEFPNTGTSWADVFLVGAGLALLGAAVRWKATRRIHE